MNFLRRAKGKQKANKVLRIQRATVTSHFSDNHFYDDDGEYAHTLLKTRVPCSCPMCGNQRRYGKGKDRLTVQEQRFLDAQRHSE